MKKQILIPVVLGGLMTFSLSVEAQQRGPGQGGRGGEGGRGGTDPRQGIREAMMKKFHENNCRHFFKNNSVPVKVADAAKVVVPVVPVKVAKVVDLVVPVKVAKVVDLVVPTRVVKVAVVDSEAFALRPIR